MAGGFGSGWSGFISFNVGDKVRLVDKKYITGRVLQWNMNNNQYEIEWTDRKLQPPVQWVPRSRLELDDGTVHERPPHAFQIKCECGSDKVPGLEGHHSRWCPRFREY